MTKSRSSIHFLQKDTELPKPFILTCHACLEHRHWYAYKNSVFAIYSIYHELGRTISEQWMAEGLGKA